MLAAPSPARPLASGPMLDQALVPVHRYRLVRLAETCAPVIAGASTLQDRWSAVRCLAEAFAPAVERERALIHRIPQIRRRGVERIDAGFEQLKRARAEVEAADREDPDDGLVALLLQNFLEQLASWSATIEREAAEIPLDTLPLDALDLLNGLTPATADAGWAPAA